MSEIKVKEYLKKYGLENSILHAKESSATVELAAKAFGVEGQRIAKSLTFMLESGPIMIVMAGDAKIDNSKYKGEFKQKAKMLTFEEVEPLIGHPIGGVCPFGVNDNVKIYLDESLKRFDTVFPACGETNNAIELTPEKLFEITNCIKWIDVSKLI